MSAFDPQHRQASYQLRMDWGLPAAHALAADADLAVVVDVLSFTTAVTVAAERGIAVHPYPWRGDGAAAYAEARDAVLAVSRSEARQHGGVSLSPAGLREVQGVERIVLPSPNGSAISFVLADSGATVLAASLRNRRAVAEWLAARLAAGRTVAVIAAGERWPDDSLRPAVEDLWGAGGVLAALADLGVGDLSPEARVAESAYRAAAEQLPGHLSACVSGRELVEAGFPDDVAIAAEVDTSTAVPVLSGAAFVVVA